MDSLLDNPVWHALSSANSHLGKGTDHAKYFDIAVSPFVAVREITTDNLAALYQLLPGNRISFLATTQLVTIPSQWKTIACVRGLQLVHDGKAVTNENIHLTTDLSPQNAAEMVSLAKLTNPGPFDMRTIEFGHYQGVFKDGKLVAMAGQRMHSFNYAEISAVCTHPDHTGKGYARQLLINQINRIIAASETPFLHAKHDNERAIALYESLGFAVRSDMHFYILKK